MAKKESTKYLSKPGATSSPLQQFSSARNWSLLQIKGSSGQLVHELQQALLAPEEKSYWISQVRTLQEKLTKAVDTKWFLEKEGFKKTVEEELWGKTDGNKS